MSHTSIRHHSTMIVSSFVVSSVVPSIRFVPCHLIACNCTSFGWNYSVDRNFINKPLSIQSSFFMRFSMWLHFVVQWEREGWAGGYLDCTTIDIQWFHLIFVAYSHPTISINFIDSEVWTGKEEGGFLHIFIMVSIAWYTRICTGSTAKTFDDGTTI